MESTRCPTRQLTSNGPCCPDIKRHVLITNPATWLLGRLIVVWECLCPRDCIGLVSSEGCIFGMHLLHICCKSSSGSSAVVQRQWILLSWECYLKNASTCCCYRILSYDILNIAGMLYERENIETGRRPTQVPVFGFPGLKDDGAFLEKEDIRRWCLSAS